MAAPKNPNPPGRKSDKIWRDAIMLAVNEVREGNGPKAQKALRLIARRVVDKALEGDMTAAKEIGDRLDGKPVQGVQGEIDGSLTIEILKFAKE